MASPNEKPVPHTHLDALPDKLWDLVVVGAGPSGSICATAVARAGFNVLLVDKEAFPRDKACGDLLIADSFSSLRRMDLLDAVKASAHAMPISRVYSPSQIYFDIPGEYLGIKRRVLDAILVRKAVAAGATLAHATIQQLSESDRSEVVIRSTEDQPTIRAKLAVLSTGSVNDLAQKADIAENCKPSAVAIRTYIESDSGDDIIHLAYVREILPGYGWIIPVGNRTYNVGCGIIYARTDNGRHHLKRQLERFLETFPPAVELMKTGKQVHHIGGASLRCGLAGVRRFSNGRILGVGETIGTTFPFTGEGIGKAMETAELAADAITAALHSDDLSSLSDYDANIRRRLAPRYQGYVKAETWLGRPGLNDFLARRISRSSFLQKAVADFMADTGNPRRIYSLRSIIRSYFQ